MSDTGNNLSTLLTPCLRCGYQIKCVVSEQCSECGYIYQKRDEITSQRRCDLVKNRKSLTRTSLFGWLAVWIFYSVSGMVAVWIVDSSDALVFSLTIASVLAMLIGGSLLLGWIASRFAPEHQRTILWITWLKTLPIIHLPWLSIAGFTAAGTLISVAASILMDDPVDSYEADKQGILVMGIILVSFVVWTIGMFILCFLLGARIRELSDDYQLHRCQPGLGMTWILSYVTWIGACLIGFMGGFLGSGVIASFH
ncbi:MAG: hypothetical protein P1U42_08370 [Phycisphaerales bacterium]|nr:hypothetical protein [Phycisphaerales bacterium]